MIGLFGGTFDPPHLGHIHLIKTLCSQFSFSSFYLIPNYQNPLKQVGPHILPEERLELLQTAITELGNQVRILDWEIRNPEPSFTIDTVQRFLKTVSEPTVFILGDECFSQLRQWKSPRELLLLTNWIVVKRNEEIMKISSRMLHDLNIKDTRWINSHHLAYSQDHNWIRFCDIEALPYSSTQMRNLLAEAWKKNTLDNPPQGIQRSVWLMIKEKRLYSVGESK